VSSLSFRVTFRCATCSVDLGPDLNEALRHLEVNPGHRVIIAVEPLSGFFR